MNSSFADIQDGGEIGERLHNLETIAMFNKYFLLYLH